MTHLTPRRLDENISHSLLGYLKTSEIFLIWRILNFPIQNSPKITESNFISILVNKIVIWKGTLGRTRLELLECSMSLSEKTSTTFFQISVYSARIWGSKLISVDFNESHCSRKYFLEFSILNFESVRRLRCRFGLGSIQFNMV